MNGSYNELTVREKNILNEILGCFCSLINPVYNARQNIDIILTREAKET